MVSLKFLVDDMCANFTEDCLYDLVKIMVDQRPCSISAIARKIAARDPSLDIKSAETLAQAAVQTLAHRAEVVIQGPYIYPAD